MSERSKTGQLSNYDLKSTIIYAIIIAAPAIIANESNIRALLEGWGINATLVSILISIGGVVLKKFLTDYTKENV